MVVALPRGTNVPRGCFRPVAQGYRTTLTPADLAARVYLSSRGPLAGVKVEAVGRENTTLTETAILFLAVSVIGGGFPVLPIAATKPQLWLWLCR